MNRGSSGDILHAAYRKQKRRYHPSQLHYDYRTLNFRVCKEEGTTGPFRGTANPLIAISSRIGWCVQRICRSEEFTSDVAAVWCPAALPRLGVELKGVR
jgi:hypothetical protein